MIVYKIPGRETLEIHNLVLDYNGTIAVNGKLIDGVKDLINKLSNELNIYILTADTYGTVEKECKDLNAKILTFPKENAGESKRKIVKELNGYKTICIGNGYNDIPMFKESILSIGIMEGEGSSGELIANSTIVSRSIVEALRIVYNKTMVKATLRS